MRQAKLACEFLLASHFRRSCWVSRLTLLDCLTTWVYLDNTRTRMRVLFYMVICASVFAENWGRFHGSLTPLALGEKFLRSLRVILYMGSPQIFNFWGERKQQSPNDASVIHCDLLAERESTAKTFLRFSIAASAQQMHLLLPIIVLCSAIFRRVFLALRSPRSLREPLLQLRCHHLALATQLAQKKHFS